MAKYKKYSQAVDEKSLALTLGILFAVLHFIGTIFMFIGGQAMVNWFLKIHFVSSSIQILPFDGVTFVVGMAGAFVAGAVFGWLFAAIWNWVVRRR